MKKTLLVVLSTALVLSLAACGSSSETAGTETVEEAVETESAEEAAKAGNVEHSDFADGPHYWNMTSVPDWFTYDDPSINQIVDTIDNFYGYDVVENSFTFQRPDADLGQNINSRFTDSDMMYALQCVGILSYDVTDSRGLRKNVPGNWTITMNEDGETHGYVTIQCLNAVGAEDKDGNDSHGEGCTINEGVDTGVISDDNNGMAVMDANVTICFVPRNALTEDFKFSDLYDFTDSDNDDLKLYGGWIVWIWEASQEMVRDEFGDSDFYTSGMYHYGDGDEDYAWTTIAGIQVKPSAETSGTYDAESITGVDKFEYQDKLIGMTVSLTDAETGDQNALFVPAENLIEIYYDADNDKLVGPTGENSASLPTAVDITENGGTVRYYIQLAGVDTDGDSQPDAITSTPYSDNKEKCYIGADRVEELLSAGEDIDSYSALSLDLTEEMPLIYFCDTEITEPVVGKHYWSIAGSVEKAPENCAEMSALNEMDTWNEMNLVEGTFSWFPYDINADTSKEEFISGFKDVGIISDDELKTDRKETSPYGWLWFIDQDTGEITVSINLDCQNAAVAGGEGCTVDDCELTGEISEDNDGFAVVPAKVSTYYIPASHDLDTVTFDNIEGISVGNGNGALLHTDGGWIIWMAVVTPDDLAEAYGPSDCDYSEMFKYTETSDGYYYMQCCGIRVDPD